MTFSAYGFIETNQQIGELRARIKKGSTGARLWLRDATLRDLHNFPRDLLPSPARSYCFTLAERPDRDGVEYLLDPRDFAPEADIGLPSSAAERFHILAQEAMRLVSSSGVLRLALALTDSDEIEQTKFLNHDALGQTILADCLIYSPPNVLYICDTE